jgi:hypothetical protein
MAWHERPVEVTNLLNPAFCGEVIYRCAAAHWDEANTPLPYSLSFLILPLVLHSETRATLRPGLRHFEVWVSVNPQIKIGLGTRARSLVPFTREALTLLYQTRAIDLRRTDAAVAIDRPLRSLARHFPLGEDTRACVRSARTLGTLLARTSSEPTVYASLGLRP